MRSKRKPPRGGKTVQHEASSASECGRALRSRRRGLGLTQAELAALAGVGLAFMYELEQGKPTVRLDKLLDVARVLGLELRLTNGKRGFSVDESLRAERDT